MLIDAVTESYNKYFFGDVGREIYDFFWGDFADRYVECSFIICFLLIERSSSVLCH
ncbi:hypothetical protein E1A91_D01G000100v1 [Gossypium mustelinum]|uniref:Methionyl/Valyl/Leucyl/Isoleucyl-tRNA synthetase anticodon-binding domain-containing protein n=1 Tax=Gossypium mustelinum TaxID=34275 RepID=A0A5D2W399_GOSMU|nr:hypothetical protein E1A91_D01G000100v1 [Gossypium mustelinum]